MSVQTRPPRPPLRRRPRDGALAGVCAGLAEWFEVDPVLIRLAFGLATLLMGIGPFLYVAAWALVPEEGAAHSEAERWLSSLREKAAPEHRTPQAESKEQETTAKEAS